MKLQYDLKQQEIEESLLCLDWKKENWKKNINLGVINFVAAICLIGYLLNTERVYLLVLSFFSVGVTLCLLYFPKFKRKKKAEKMTTKDGIYQLQFPPRNITTGFESENVFTICMEKEIYCVPKRSLDSLQCQLIRKVLKKETDKFYEVVTGRKLKYE